MFVALIAHDKPGALDIRTANRPAHVEYLKSTGVVAQADMGAAQDWADNDPYAKAGLFSSVSLTHWNRVVG